MTISGNAVHDKIGKKIGEVESQSQKLQREIYNYENDITELTEEREQCFVRLATTYLPDLEAKSVQQTLAEVQETVKKIFREKQQKRSELEDLMQSSQTTRKQLEKQLEGATEKLNKKVSERDELTKQTAQELSTIPDYVELDRTAEPATETLMHHRQRVKEAKEEAKEKLPAYRENKLFMYLVNRKFGANEYEGKGLVATLDSWVAKKVGFEEAKKCFDFLQAMPELMQIKVDKEQEELDVVLGKMQAIEKGVSDKYGLPKVIEEGKKLGEERERVIGQVKQEDMNYAGYSQQRKDLDTKKDPYHVEAIQKLKSFLKGETIQELKEKASSTPRTEDDKLVSRLEEIDSSVRELKDKSKTTRTTRDSVEKKLSGLKEIKSRFTSKDYESSRSYFDNDFDINSLLIGYLAGRYTQDSIDSAIEESQHLRPIETYHSSSDYSYSSRRDSDDSGSHSSGSGFGGGGFSSGGGFGGGGGFSSGKGF